MTELKTLKDLGFHWSKYRTSKDFFIKSHKEKAYGEGELREEAIKWVKELRKLPQIKDIQILKEQSRMNDGARLWVLNFFNLTEEDLK